MTSSDGGNIPAIGVGLQQHEEPEFLEHDYSKHMCETRQRSTKKHRNNTHQKDESFKGQKHIRFVPPQVPDDV